SPGLRLASDGTLPVASEVGSGMFFAGLRGAARGAKCQPRHRRATAHVATDPPPVSRFLPPPAKRIQLSLAITRPPHGLVPYQHARTAPNRTATRTATDDCTGSAGTCPVMRVTVLKAAADGLSALLDYYAGLAEDQQRRDGVQRGPVD